VASRRSFSAPLVLARRLYLDSVLILMVAAVLCTLAVVLPIGAVWSAVLAVAALVLIVPVARERSTDATEEMERGAGRIADLLPARFIVMGHSHGAKRLSVGEGQIYFNLGHWGQDDLPEDRPAGQKPPCTHLVITERDGEMRAELRRWDADAGAQPFVEPAVPGTAPVRAPSPAPLRPALAK